MKKVLILNSDDILQKTRRIAYQIVEENYDEKEIVMLGIKPHGFQYAEVLKREIDAINSLKVSLLPIELNKTKPLEEEIKLEASKKGIDNKVIVVVDDV